MGRWCSTTQLETLLTSGCCALGANKVLVNVLLADAERLHALEQLFLLAG